MYPVYLSASTNLVEACNALYTARFADVCCGAGMEDTLLSACQQLTAPDQAVLAHLSLTARIQQQQEQDTLCQVLCV